MEFNPIRAKEARSTVAEYTNWTAKVMKHAGKYVSEEDCEKRWSAYKVKRYG